MNNRGEGILWASLPPHALIASCGPPASSCPHCIMMGLWTNTSLEPWPGPAFASRPGTNQPINQRPPPPTHTTHIQNSGPASSPWQYVGVVCVRQAQADRNQAHARPVAAGTQAGTVVRACGSNTVRRHMRACACGCAGRERAHIHVCMCACANAGTSQFLQAYTCRLQIYMHAGKGRNALTRQVHSWMRGQPGGAARAGRAGRKAKERCMHGVAPDARGACVACAMDGGRGRVA